MSKASELYGAAQMKLSELERTNQGATPQADVFRDRMERLKSMFPNLSGSFMGAPSAMGVPPSMRSSESQSQQDGEIKTEADFRREVNRARTEAGLAPLEYPDDLGGTVDGQIHNEADFQAELKRARRLAGVASS